jgi:Arc/MetJ-type ribon-helix-helix transcriptional regulator
MKMKERMSIPVSLPKGLAKNIDELVKEGEFSSRSELLRFGARLVVMLEKRTHKRAEDYAYSEIKEGLKRGMRNVSRH